MAKHRIPDLSPGGGPRSRRFTPRRRPEDNVRVAAAWVLERTLASSAPASGFLDGVLPRFEERDRALLRELVFGTLRWLRRLDHIIGTASHRRFSEIEPPLRAPLRVAAYQLLFLDRVPSYAAIDEAVEQARSLTHRGGASFVNAVLRRIARDPTPAAWPVREGDEVRRRAIELSHPDFLVRRWADRFGWQRTLALMEANNRPKPLALLAFRDRGGRELLAERLIDEGLEVGPSLLSPTGLVVHEGDPVASEAFRDGDLYLQDEASQVAALLPPPRAGERILDAAAAPGGKSFALLAWEPEVELVLADLDVARLSVLRANLLRLRRELPLLAGDAGRPAIADGRFQRVVVDLPCSGTGTFRKHPELKWRLSEDEIGRLSAQAARLLAGVAPLVAPDGLLVAITCSLEREENEDVIAALRERRPELVPRPLDEDLPEPRWRQAIEAEGRWRLLPGGSHDGFTVHTLARASSLY